MKVTLETQNPMTEEAVKSATGKTWEEWFALLDERGGTGPGKRRELGNYLYADCKLDIWWSATINVEYENARGVLDKDNRPKGYMICSTKTIAAPVEKVYAAWVSNDALDRWFSAHNDAEVTDGGCYKNGDGDTGVYKRVRADKDLRFTWENPAHSPATIVDVTFQDNGKGKTLVTVSHDRIQTRAQADGLRDGWGEALDKLKVWLES